MEEEAFYVRMFVKLECECGAEEAVVGRTDIEALDGGLLMEVRCRGCGEPSRIPSGVSEAGRELLGDDYRPTYYLTEEGEVVHWSSPEGRTRRMEAALEGPIGSKKSE